MTSHTEKAHPKLSAKYPGGVRRGVAEQLVGLTPGNWLAGTAGVPEDWRVARLRDIVIDCSHPASLARFWAEALDGYAVAPYDEDEIERLRSLGVDDLEDDPSVLVEGPGPRIFVQLVPEAKQVKNRVHLDLIAADVDAEIGRLAGLGAHVVERYERHVLLADPQGNEFCVMRDPG